MSERIVLVWSRACVRMTLSGRRKRLMLECQRGYRQPARMASIAMRGWLNVCSAYLSTSVRSSAGIRTQCLRCGHAPRHLPAASRTIGSAHPISGPRRSVKICGDPIASFDFEDGSRGGARARTSECLIQLGVDAADVHGLRGFGTRRSGQVGLDGIQAALIASLATFRAALAAGVSGANADRSRWS